MKNKKNKSEVSMSLEGFTTLLMETERKTIEKYNLAVINLLRRSKQGDLTKILHGDNTLGTELRMLKECFLGKDGFQVMR